LRRVETAVFWLLVPVLLLPARCFERARADCASIGSRWSARVAPTSSWSWSWSWSWSCRSAMEQSCQAQ